MTQVLHLASYQSFQCHSCGRCCRNSWAIRVEPAAQPAIAESGAAERCQKEGFVPLVVLDDLSVVTGRRDDGACVFLTSDELCAVHGELGGGRKPLACQLFPYSLTATPDGHFASLSFACPAVVAGWGGDLSANQRELEDLLAERGFATERPQRIEVVAGRYVSWASYLELEQRLLAAFRSSDPVGSLLSSAVGVVQSLAATDSATDPTPWLDLAAVEREEPFEESLLAMFSASVIALWERPGAPEQRQAFSQAVLAGEPLLSDRHGGIPLGAYDLERAVDPLAAETFQRYFDNAVFGKSLLTAPVVSRLLMLACGLSLVLYYGRAFAHARGADEPDLQALSRAFELVEADLVTHTRSADSLFLTFEATLAQAYGLHPE